MTESLWLVIAIVVAETLILLGAVIPGQFQDTFAVSSAVLWKALLSWVAQEVEGEAGIRVAAFAEERHAHDLLVEFERLLSILNPDHCVVHQVRGDISLLYTLRLFDRLAADDFNP